MDSMQLDAIREIGNIGGGHAATALSSLLGCQISVEIPKAELVSVYELNSYYDDPDSAYAAVFASSNHKEPFNFMLLIKESDVSKLVILLMYKQFKQKVDMASMPEEMTDSALCEIGNILLGSFLSAIDGFLGASGGMSTPSVAHDTLASILSVVSAMFGEYGDVALVTKSNLIVGTGTGANSIGANILLASGPEALEALLVKLGVM
jgi:chemotaxis protein CheC